jgi:hypothetical protein
MSMQALRVLIWSAAVVAIFLGSNWSGAAGPVDLELTPLVADLLAAPHAVRGSDRRMHLVYEIRTSPARGSVSSG